MVGVKVAARPRGQLAMAPDSGGRRRGQEGALVAGVPGTELGWAGRGRRLHRALPTALGRPSRT